MGVPLAKMKVWELQALRWVPTKLCQSVENYPMINWIVEGIDLSDRDSPLLSVSCFTFIVISAIYLYLYGVYFRCDFPMLHDVYMGGLYAQYLWGGSWYFLLFIFLYMGWAGFYCIISRRIGFGFSCCSHTGINAYIYT